MPRRRARDGSRRPRNGSPDHADLRESDSPRLRDIPARYARPDSRGRATLHRDGPFPVSCRRGRESHEGLLRHRAGHPLRGVRRCDRGRHGRLGGPDENRRRCYLRPRAARGPASGGGPAMKLVRFSTAGSEPRLGAVAGAWNRWEWIVDLSAADPAIPSETVAFIDACPDLKGDVWERASHVVKEAERFESDAPPWAFRPKDVRVRSPILPRLLRDFLAFRAHVARTRAATWTSIPPEWDWMPGYYNGNHLNIVGTGDEVLPMRFETFDGKSPRLILSPKMDYEAEIGFVLGKGGREIDVTKAPGHLFGVTIFNDFSARDIQVTAGKIGMGPAPGKDWANALGPCIVTRDEFGDLRDQSIAVRVNNEERLRDRYRNMVFENPWAKEGPRALWSFPEMVEFLSRFQPIYAGEVWGSGTIPGGCEFERGDRARYLKPGDRVEIEIEGIGVLQNSIALAT